MTRQALAALALLLALGARAAGRGRGLCPEPGRRVAGLGLAGGGAQPRGRLQPDGSLSFPLAGQVAAADRTPGDVGKAIKKRMTAIPDAVVSVELIEARGNKVFILGEVNRR